MNPADRRLIRPFSQWPDIAAAAIGLCLTALAVSGAVHRERQVERSAMAEDGARIASSVHRAFDFHAMVAMAVEGLFASSEEVTGEEFRSFAQQFLPDHPAIRVLAVAQMDGAGYAIRFAEDGTTGRWKLDDQTFRRLTAGLTDARRHGGLWMTPVPTETTGPSHRLLLVALPVSSASVHRIRVGKPMVVFALVATELALEEAIAIAARQQRIFSVFSTGDDTDPPSPIYCNHPSALCRRSPSTDSLSHRVSFHLGRRSYAVDTALHPAASDTPDAMIWVTLGIGLLVSILFTGYVRMLRRASAADRRRAADERTSRLAVEKLLALQEKTQSISHVGSWECEPGGSRIDLSDEACRIFGLAPGAAPVTGPALLALCHRDDVERVREAFESTAEQHRDDYQIDFRIRRADDSAVRHVHGECHHIREAGHVVRSEGIVQDITERMQMTERLLVSEKMLSVGGLAAGVAHEINNPLAGILQSAAVLRHRLDTMRDAPANAAAAAEAGTRVDAIRSFMEKRGILHLVDTIDHAAGRAADIVRNMLSFARTADHAPLPADLERIIDCTLRLARTEFDVEGGRDFRKIRIEREDAPDLPKVPCDEPRLQQVLLNLLQNAAQAMHEAGTSSPTIRICTSKSAAGDKVRIDICDNGPGMDEVVRRRCFEPFFTTKPAGSGTGLGLAVSYFIITEHHRGSLTVESAPQQGTRFIIELPIRG